jgi:hypothetical protein
MVFSGKLSITAANTHAWALMLERRKNEDLGVRRRREGRREVGRPMKLCTTFPHGITKGRVHFLTQMRPVPDVETLSG